MNPQLGIVMVGTQALHNLGEICNSATLIHKGRASTTPLCSTSHPWETDNELEEMPPIGLFYEYLEMVVQVGDITYIHSCPIYLSSFVLRVPIEMVINVDCNLSLSSLLSCSTST